MTDDCIWGLTVSLWLPQVRWVFAPSPPCSSPSSRTRRWSILTSFLCQSRIWSPSLGKGYKLRICRGPGCFLPLKMIRNPISFYAYRTHQDMCSPDHRIIPKEAWKVQYHLLQTALRRGVLALTLTARWQSVGLSLTPTASYVDGKPVVSDLAVIPHRFYITF